MENAGVVFFTGNNVSAISLPNLRQQTVDMGMGPVTMWALSLVMDATGPFAGGPKALVVIENENELVNVSMPALSVVYDVVLSKLPKVCGIE